MIRHPRTLDAVSPRFLLPRYETLRTITLDGFAFMMDFNEVEDVGAYLAGLPAGFIRDPYHGPGLTYDIRLIVETVETLKASDLHITKGAKGDGTIDGASYRAPFALFDAVRRDIKNPDATKLAVPTVTVKKPRPRRIPDPGRQRR